MNKVIKKTKVYKEFLKKWISSDKRNEIIKIMDDYLIELAFYFYLMGAMFR